MSSVAGMTVLDKLSSRL